VRRLTQARVGGLALIRVIMIRRSERLACRSPSRLSRCRRHKPSRPGARAVTQGDDLLVQAVELVTRELGTAAQFPQRDRGGVADDLAGARPQLRQPGDQLSGRVPSEPGADVVAARHDQRPGRACGPSLPAPSATRWHAHCRHDPAGLWSVTEALAAGNPSPPSDPPAPT
jgi:hypothetical protein